MAVSSSGAQCAPLPLAPPGLWATAAMIDEGLKGCLIQRCSRVVICLRVQWNLA